MSTRTQSLLLLVFGVVLLRLGTTDLLLRFVKPGARPFVVAAGAAIIALSLWSLVRAGSGRERSTEHGTDGHDHSGAPRIGWLAVLPVVAILVIGPPPLGAFTAGRQSAPVPPRSAEPFGPLPAGDTTMSVTEFAVRALDHDGRTLHGRRVTLTGFVLQGTDSGFVLARLVITCCAADAIPVEVMVRSGRPAPPTNSWVQVSGTYLGQAGHYVPIMRAASQHPVAEPADPYDS